MRQDERAPFVTALHRARHDAFPLGEYVGQESFMTASDILSLAARAGIGRGRSVLDVCCGVGGPGRLIATELRCDYLGVDYSASALDLAREQAGTASCRFVQSHVPPLPSGVFDVVLLLETMLAFDDKRALLRAVSDALPRGGAFACTVEVGSRLAADERARMPDADTVHPIDLAELVALLAEVGLTVTWSEDCTAAHHAIAASLLDSFRARSAEIARHVGSHGLDDLLTAHQLWSEWLGSGRVRKYALIARKHGGPAR